MKKGLIISAIVCIAMVIFAFVFSKTKKENIIEYRTYQHYENKEANSLIGQTEIPSTGIIDKNEFVTHLPLVVIDTHGQEVPNIVYHDADGTRRYIDENITDPYISATISIIDNDNYENHIYDEASLVNNGKIKLRGNSSRHFDKKNYGIKLLDENGDELETEVLGMDEDEDWILSNSILDATLIRNYIAYNIGGQLFPYTPDAKFCEVIIKDGDTYNYQGLFLLSESIKKSESRVDIEDFNESQDTLSFILKRDRADATTITLDTWASTNNICYGYFILKYPSENKISKDAITRIENELSLIEKTIYSDNTDTFSNYTKYIDVDSFIDYFVFNEFMMCYDSGNNSTYYYQDSNHKFSMGPLWDYDNCFDNYKQSVGDPEYVAYVEKPWFEKLIQDPDFQKKLIKRYKQLRKTILSDKYFEEFVDETVAYIGNAALRDRSRWSEIYEKKHMLLVVEDGHGFVVNRNRELYEDEILRLKDTEKMHADWLDKYMGDFLSDYINKDLNTQKIRYNSYIAIAALAVFLISIIVIRKKLDSQ